MLCGGTTSLKVYLVLGCAGSGGAWRQCLDDHNKSSFGKLLAEFYRVTSSLSPKCLFNFICHRLHLSNSRTDIISLTRLVNGKLARVDKPTSHTIGDPRRCIHKIRVDPRYQTDCIRWFCNGLLHHTMRKKLLFKAAFLASTDLRNRPWGLLSWLTAGRRLERVRRGKRDE